MVVIFTGGAALVLDAGITVAIIVQLFLTSLDLTSLRGGLEVAELQSLLINLAIIVFLLRNIADFRSTTESNQKQTSSEKKIFSEVKTEVKQQSRESTNAVNQKAGSELSKGAKKQK